MSTYDQVRDELLRADLPTDQAAVLRAAFDMLDQDLIEFEAATGCRLAVQVHIVIDDEDTQPLTPLLTFADLHRLDGCPGDIGISCPGAVGVCDDEATQVSPAALDFAAGAEWSFVDEIMKLPKFSEDDWLDGAGDDLPGWLR